MIEEKKNGDLNIQRINGVECKIKRRIDSIRETLNGAMQKIGDALIYTITVRDEHGEYLLREDSTKEDQIETCSSTELMRKNMMVTYASTVGMKEDELMVLVVELSENILGLARSFYEDSNPRQCKKPDPSQADKANLAETEGNGPNKVGNHFPPPLSSCGEYGAECASLPPVASGRLERLATLAFFKSSTDRDMIEACCELVKAVCDLENSTVIRREWKNLPDDKHPSGIIGHTYHILYSCGKYTKDFRKRFQEEADDLFNEASTLRKKADALIERLQETEEQDTPEQVKHAYIAIQYLSSAVALLKNASLLIEDASGFVGNRLNPPSS